jgi:hypothetical protein
VKHSAAICVAAVVLLCSAASGQSAVPAPARGKPSAIEPQRALSFAREWIAAWNSHDLERILSHYTEDFEMASPLIIERLGEPSGVLKGKTAIRSYWARGLAAKPPLRFELVGVFAGVRSITIHYRSVGRRDAAEVLQFTDAGQVERAAAHYVIPQPTTTAAQGK